jgi:hypothetical protein
MGCEMSTGHIFLDILEYQPHILIQQAYYGLRTSLLLMDEETNIQVWSDNQLLSLHAPDACGTRMPGASLLLRFESHPASSITCMRACA